MDYREYLMHFGVMGMRWGKRRSATYISTKNDKKKANKELSKAKKKKAKAEAKLARILKSPTKLRKNLDSLKKEDVDKAMSKMRTERELKGLARDKISAGSQFASSILSYGTVAVTAYGIYKSPLAQSVSDLFKE